MAIAVKVFQVGNNKMVVLNGLFSDANQVGIFSVNPQGICNYSRAQVGEYDFNGIPELQHIDQVPGVYYPSTTKGNVLPKDMHDNHIISSIKKAEREGNTGKPWYRILCSELGRRGLEIK
mgnify:CR=1 FL=1